MALTAGTLSRVSVTDTTASVLATAPTGGTTPYLYQWYKSTVTGFTPSTANAISGATALALTDTGLIPGTQYYYKQVQTDSNATPLTATPTQLSVPTSQPLQSPNQFTQTSQLGVLDLRFNKDTVSVEIDSTQATALYAGMAVKMVDSIDGVPKVIGCAANSDNVLGFINYDLKSQSFLAGDRAEISMAGNVMYLYATTAIARGAQVTLDLTTQGGVASKNTGDNIVGWAYDKAAAVGALIRIYLKTPSYTTA